MKHILSILTLVLSLSSLSAQTGNYPVPAIKNVPFLYDEYRNTLVPLEEVKTKRETVRAGMWGKHDIIILHAPESNVPIKKTKTTKFIISCDGSDSEMYSKCLLNTAEVNDKLKRREWVAATKGARGKAEEHDEVLITFKSIGNGLFLINLDKKLKKGELFFQIDKSETVYAFTYK